MLCCETGSSNCHSPISVIQMLGCKGVGHHTQHIVLLNAYNSQVSFSMCSFPHLKIITLYKCVTLYYNKQWPHCHFQAIQLSMNSYASLGGCWEPTLHILCKNSQNMNCWAICTIPGITSFKKY